MTEEISQNELLALRRAKLDDLRSKGNAFPNDFRRDALAEELHAAYDSFEKDKLQSKKVEVSVAGRVMLQRVMGKASFITIQDLSGQIQAYIKADNLGAEAYKEFKKWDLGDVVGLKGELFKTKTNELTVEANSIFLLTKSLKPLPEKHAGLVDTEQRYRKRYLDLLTNPESLEVFKKRSKILSEIRNIFFEEGQGKPWSSQLGPGPTVEFSVHQDAVSYSLLFQATHGDNSFEHVEIFDSITEYVCLDYQACNYHPGHGNSWSSTGNVCNDESLCLHHVSISSFDFNL